MSQERWTSLRRFWEFRLFSRSWPSSRHSSGLSGSFLGLLTRVAAFGIGCVMLVAASIHYKYGFYMNWFQNQEGEGFEYHLLALSIAVALILKGAGRWSLDGMISRRMNEGA